MRLAGSSLYLCLAALLSAAAGEDPAGDRLSDTQKREIYLHIDSCAPLGIELGDIAKHVEAIRKTAGGRPVAVDYIVQHGLGHREPQARLAAIEALALIGNVGNDRALRKLQDMVEFDPNYTVRRHAARAIAGFGDGIALHKLFLELPDLDGSLRKRLLFPPDEAPKAAADRKARLANLAKTISRALDRFDSLVERLDDSVDPEERSQARAELGRLIGPIPGERDEDWRAWWAACKGVPPPLHEEVNRTADRATTIALIELAAMIDASGAIPGITRVLRHGELPVKLAAAAALGRLIQGAKPTEAAPAIDALRSALADDSGWVRSGAAAALTAGAPKECVGDFEKLLADWAPGDRSAEHRAMLARVRRAGVAGLRTVRAQRAIGRVAALLVDEPVDRMLAWEVVEALREMGLASELAPLARHAARAAEHERQHAIAAAQSILGRSQLGPPDGIRPAEAAATRIWELAGSRQPAPALLAVLELHRREELEARAASISALSNPEARILAVTLLAHRRWTPAVADLASVAERSASEPSVALAACRAVAEVASDEALKAYRKRGAASGGGETGQLTDNELAERRHRAAEALLKILERADVSPRVAGQAAGALAVVIPWEDETLRTRAVGALIEAVQRSTLRDAWPEVYAALRLLGKRGYPDEPKLWLEWWKGRQGSGR